MSLHLPPESNDGTLACSSSLVYGSKLVTSWYSQLKRPAIALRSARPHPNERDGTGADTSGHLVAANGHALLRVSYLKIPNQTSRSKAFVS